MGRLWLPPERRVVPQPSFSIPLLGCGKTAAGGAVPLASDSFNRANSSSLGSTDGLVGSWGQKAARAWQERNGDTKIISNRLDWDVWPGGVGLVATFDCTESDIILRGQVNIQGGLNGIVLRYDDNDDGFWLVGAAPTSFHIYERSGSAWTVRANVVVGGNGLHTILIEAIGSTINAWFDESNKLTYASATFNQSATEVGYRFHSGATTYGDNIEVWKHSDFPEALPA